MKQMVQKYEAFQSSAGQLIIPSQETERTNTSSVASYSDKSHALKCTTFISSGSFSYRKQNKLQLAGVSP